MTPGEIALVREALTWAQLNGFQRRTWTQPIEYGEMPSIDLKTGLWRSGRAVAFEADNGAWSIGVDPDGGVIGHHFTWHPVTTVAMAVDLLVDAEILPQRFHSAYRAGWAAADLWHRDVASFYIADLGATTNDPNAPFPAGGIR